MKSGAQQASSEDDAVYASVGVHGRIPLTGSLWPDCRLEGEKGAAKSRHGNL